MGTYYIDFDSGVDSAGRGTTTSDPYLTPSFAMQDVVATHGKDTTGGDKFLCIGTYTPTSNLDIVADYGAPNANSQCIFMNDGRSAFGTAGHGSRAEFDLSSNGGILINDSSLDHTSFYGFKWTGMVDNVFALRMDNYIVIADNWMDYTGFTGSNPKFSNMDSQNNIWGNLLSNLVCTASSTHDNARLFQFNAAGSTFAWNKLSVENNGTPTAGRGPSCLRFAATGNAAFCNSFQLEGPYRGCYAESDNAVYAFNDFFGKVAQQDQRGIYFQGGTGRENNAVFGNHFENLTTAINHTSGNITAGACYNTFYNNTNNITTTGADIQYLEEIDLLRSGFMDLANDDFRPTLARMQAIMSQATIPYTPIANNFMMFPGVPLNAYAARHNRGF